MSTTQPIRDKKALSDFKNYYLLTEPHPRNYVLIIMGLNTALRISDMLRLTWEMLYHQETQRFYSHLLLNEQKTGKETRIFLNNEVKNALTFYMRHPDTGTTHGYLFQSNRNRENPLSRFQAYRIIRKAAEKVGMEDIVRCHSLRKTFGYHAWKQGTPPALLMEIYNHSSYQITKHYLGIEQDDKDAVYRKIVL